MIVVDSSVWIDFINGRRAPHVAHLQAILGSEEIIVGDLMLCEVLQGLASERAARQVEGLLRRFEIASMAGEAVAIAAARNFRSLRRRGITVRKTIDRGASKTAGHCCTMTAIFGRWHSILGSWKRP